MMQLNPLEEAMVRLLDQIFAKDAQEIFTEPVDIEEVPDYTDVVTHPMDLSTMRSKLRDGKYTTLDDMENDFILMIQNCLAYNNKDTIFYRAGIRMRDQCSPLFKSVRKELIREGIVEKPLSDEQIALEVDTELTMLVDQKLSYDELLPKLHDLMEKSMRIKHGMIRQKRVKNVKAEMAKAKKLSRSTENSPNKSITIQKNAKRARSPMETSQSDDQDQDQDQNETNKIESIQLTTPNCSPVKNVSSNSSPSGVNRRTAVLFRKAKATASVKKVESTNGNEENQNNAEQTFQSKQQQTNALQTSTPTVLSQTTATENTKVKSPKKLSRSTRNSSLASEAGSTLANFDNKHNSSSASSLAMASTSSIGNFQKKISPIKERYVPSNTMPDSFRMYRGRGKQSSESDDSNMSCMHSECSSCSGSEFG